MYTEAICVFLCEKAHLEGEERGWRPPTHQTYWANHDAHSWNSRYLDAEVGGWKIQGHSGLQSEFKTSMGNLVRVCLSQNKKNYKKDWSIGQL